MFGVAFHREADPKLQDLWSFVFSNFGVSHIWEKGFQEGDGKIYQPTVPYETYDDLPDVPLAVFAPSEGKYVRGTESLVDFEHPADCIYAFGGSHENLTVEEMGNRKPHLIYIPSVHHEMYAHCAGYIALYDRLVKRGDFG